MAYNVKFLKGTAAELAGITRDLNTFYYVDEADLYLGNVKLSNGADLAAAIVRIAAIEADYLKNADKTALQGQIDTINQELGALTGTDSGKSIGKMIEDAIAELDGELRPLITANTNAIDAIEADYLKGADKTELEGKITAEQQRAEGIEGGLNTRLAAVEADYLKAADKTELAGDISTNADAIAAVKEDVDAFFKDADLTANAKDTLKEIQAYINSDATAAAEMTASIQQNAQDIEAIEKDYLKAADKTELNNAIALKADKTTVEGIDERLTEAEGAVATKAEAADLTALAGRVSANETAIAGKAAQADLTAVTNRVTTAEGKITAVEGKLEGVTKVTESIATAKSEAIEAAATDATTKANTAEQNAKDYADSLAGNYDVKGAANTALTEAKSYADGVAATAKTGAVTEAKAYADGLATNYDAAGSASAAQAAAKTYTDTEIGKLDTVYEKVGVAETKANAALASAKTYAEGEADTAEANAKAYVDTALTWGSIA